jgi:acyl-CoA thioesterase FadM
VSVPGFPFRLPHRVGFGECDPARIFYAPRAVDWAAEALEAWFESALGCSWGELAAGPGLEVRVLRVDCEYRRSAVAGQVLQLVVASARAEGQALSVEAVGEIGPGDASFRARLRTAFFDRVRSAPAEIPPAVRERAAAYQALCPPSAAEEMPAPPPPGGSGPPPAAGAGAPFVARRRVAWGDCGPTGHAHAQRAVDHAVEAAGEWYESTLGISWLEQCRRGRGTPFLHIGCDLLRPLAAGEELALAVRIPRLGRASIGYRVSGFDGRGRLCLDAQMAACYVDDERGPARSMPFPDELRRRILAYQAACEAR